MNKISKSLALATLTLGLPLASCGSGSTEPLPQAVTALGLPDSVSIVEPDVSDVWTGPSGSPMGGSSFGGGADYNDDAATIRVYDPILETLEDVNGTLCEVALARPTRFLNDRPYMAQVDTAMCGEERARTEGEGIDTAQRVSTFDVDRASDSDPQVTEAWLPFDADMMPVTLHAEMTVTGEPVALDPFGEIEIQLAGVESGGTVQSPLVYGAFASAMAEAGFRFLHNLGDVDVAALNPGDASQRVQMIVEADATAGTGSAKITEIARYNIGMGDSGQITSTTRLVYDQAHVKRQTEMEPEVVLSRADYTNHVFSYNVYYNTGANAGERVELSTGMGVTLASGSYGWVGYHGTWAPPGEMLSDGDTVTSLDGMSTYTVRRAPGRLYRATRGTILLSALTDQRFEWIEMGQRYEIAHGGVEWQRVAVWNSITESFDEIMNPTMVDVAMEGGVLFMWSPTLGGTSYEDGASQVAYFRSELVTGSDPIFMNGPSVDVYGLFRGLKGDISQVEADGGDVFLSTPGNVTNAHKYTISNTDMTLFHDVNGDGSVMERVGLSPMVTPTMGPNQWGMCSGPLVLSTSLASMSSVFDILDETTYYVYETGHNPWNRFVGLYGPGTAYVQFDVPLQLRYTHSTMDDMNGDMTYDGEQVLFTYAGPGKLLGIPGTEVDVDGDMIVDRYYPDFSLKDGTVIGSGGEYIVRAIGVEQTLNIDLAGAPTLDLTTADLLVVPPLTLYMTPGIGPRPNVTDPPAVIDGTMQ